MSITNTKCTKSFFKNTKFTIYKKKIQKLQKFNIAKKKLTKIKNS